MAERRMFSKVITQSAKFLRMPPSTRLLYYDLGMAADDDGVVEAFSVMKMTSATEDDLRVLVSKGYVRILNEELVALINDWKVNNLIKNDRYHPSIYKDLLLQIGTEHNAMEPNWNQSGTQMEPEVRLGKDSIGNSKGDKSPKHKHGDYGHVLLTDDQYSKLVSDFGESIASEYIRKVDEYCQMHGKSYKDYNLAIRQFLNRDSKNKVTPEEDAPRPATVWF